MAELRARARIDACRTHGSGRDLPWLTASPTLVLVDGDIGKQETAAKSVEAAIEQFGSIDVLVNNAGIFYTKPFTDFTTEDFNALVSTNLSGFLYLTQLTARERSTDDSPPYDGSPTKQPTPVSSARTAPSRFR